MKKIMVAKFIGAMSMLSAGMLVAAPAHAQDSVSLEGDVKVVRSVVEDGVTKDVLAEPKDVVPGDRLVFSTKYNNETPEIVEDFVVTNPLPSAVTLADNGEGFEVSVDGGATYGALAEMQVTDGEAGNRPAQLADVTHIRWTLARLEPGASGDLSYNAIVR